MRQLSVHRFFFALFKNYTFESATPTLLARGTMLTQLPPGVVHERRVRPPAVPVARRSRPVLPHLDLALPPRWHLPSPYHRCVPGILAMSNKYSIQTLIGRAPL